MRKNKSLMRRLKAGWRDTVLLTREFFWPLTIFSVVVLGGAWLYFIWAKQAGEPIKGFSEAIYIILSLTFFQPSIQFPSDWHLQIFFFLVPIAGIILFAQGITEFVGLMFNRRARSKEWEMAVASTFKDHIILVGLGHLGFQVLNYLIDLDSEVVAIEINPKTDLFEEAKKAGVPVLADDANRQSVLMDAKIDKAKCIILCTQNDSLNLQVATKARALNPNIKVITRIFDQSFAEAIRSQFGFTAISASVMSAPAFAAAAVGLEMTRPINIEGHILSLVKFEVRENSKLIGKSVKDIEQTFDASIVLIRCDGKTDLHPPEETQISSNATLGILATPPVIKQLIRANE